jgi:hypothetical protein
VCVYTGTGANYAKLSVFASTGGIRKSVYAGSESKDL